MEPNATRLARLGALLPVAVTALARRRRGGWTSESVKSPPLNVFIEKSADSPSRKEASLAPCFQSFSCGAGSPRATDPIFATIFAEFALKTCLFRPRGWSENPLRRPNSHAGAVEAILHAASRPQLQITVVASPRFESIRARVPSLPWDLERSDDQAGSRRSILEVYERALLDARADEINEFVPARLVDREILPFVKDRHVRLEHRGV
jgi:hypothetical protein